MFKNIKIKQEIKKVTKDSFNLGNWLDKDTYVCYIKMSDILKKLLKDIIDGDDVEFMAEYWKDKKMFHYLLVFKDETISISDKVECKYLNNVFMEYLKTA